MGAWQTAGPGCTETPPGYGYEHRFRLYLCSRRRCTGQGDTKPEQTQRYNSQRNCRTIASHKQKDRIPEHFQHVTRSRTAGGLRGNQNTLTTQGGR